MRRFKLTTLFAIVFLPALTSAAQADSLTFTVMPTAVSGPAGTTVGWGFSITNTSSTDYLDISGIDSDLFSSSNGTPDASVFLFPNLAPGETATQSYDPVNGLGLFQFTWNSNVAAGTTESGQFRLMGAFCDPNLDQFCAEDLSVSSTILATQNYSATVTPVAGPTTVPEPSSILLLNTGLCGIGFWKWHTRSREIRLSISDLRTPATLSSKYSVRCMNCCDSRS